MIGDVWIIDKNSGVCLIHKNFDKSQRLDSNLFSGLLTAIINFSAEVTSGDYVKSVTMGSRKFFYNISDYFIIAISMDLSFNEVDAKIFLGNILTSFIKLGYADKALNTQDISILEPFGKAIDKVVQNTAKIISSDQSVAEVSDQQYQQVTKIESPEISLKKTKIEDAIENAEWALSIGNYKDAVIYFHVAVGLFQEIGEFDMATWCQEMIHLTKMMEIQEEVEVKKSSTAKQEELPRLAPIEASETVKEHIKPAKMVNKTKAITKQVQKPVAVKPKKFYKSTYKRIPFLPKKLSKKLKISLKESKVLQLCNGINTIEEISEKTGINLLKINEILKKYQKKKLLRIKRVVT